MPKSEQVLSLPVFMAIGPLQGATQKQLLGGDQVKAGAFVAIMRFLYESCALLGRMFKHDVISLGQLLRVKSGNETAFVEFVKKQAGERLEQYHQIYNTDPDSLGLLVIATYYAEVGLIYPCGNVGSFDDSKRIEQAAQGKVEIKNDKVWHRLEMHLCEAVGFGLAYPELTWELVSRFHHPTDFESENWKEFQSLTGTATPQNWADSPQKAETVVLDIATGYVQYYMPELTDTLNLLKKKLAV